MTEKFYRFTPDAFKDGNMFTQEIESFGLSDSSDDSSDDKNIWLQRKVMMNSIAKLLICLFMVSAGWAHAYLIQGLDLDIEYWTGDGNAECVVAVDWNNTNGPYQTPFHLFGFRWREFGEGAWDRSACPLAMASSKNLG